MTYALTILGIVDVSFKSPLLNIFPYVDCVEFIRMRKFRYKVEDHSDLGVNGKDNI